MVIRWVGAVGPRHSLDSTLILPQLIPGLSQLGPNRQPHNKSFKKRRAEALTRLHPNYFGLRFLKGNAHLIARTVSYFLFVFIVRVLDSIMPRGIPPPFKTTVCSLEHGQYESGST